MVDQKPKVAVSTKKKVGGGLAGAAAVALVMAVGALKHDRRRRHAAASQIARDLTERLRCFDIRSDDGARVSASQA